MYSPALCTWGSTYLKVWIGQCKPFQCWAELILLRRPTLQFVYTFHMSPVYTYCVSGCTCLLHSNLWPNSSHGSHVHHLTVQHCQYYPWNKLSTPKQKFTKNVFYLTFSIGYSIITLCWAHFTAQWENNPSGVTWTYSQLAQSFNRSLENMKSLFHEEGSWSQPVGPLHGTMC